jgi:iron complex outermembrane recepter protein
MTYRFIPLILLLLSPILPAQNVVKRSDSLRSVPAFNMDEVVVTATRVGEPVLEVPLAVTALPAAEFARTKRFGLSDALDNVPGVFAQSRSGSVDNRITIRGFGARGNGDRSNAGNLRGIRILQDGFPLTEPDGRTSLDLVNLAAAGTIEIVRSNASALYGGASGGVIQLRSPAVRNSFVDMQTTSGANGLLNTSLSSGLRGASSSYFVNVTNNVYEGWRTHSANYRTLVQGVVSAALDDATNLVVTAIGTSNLMRFPGALTRAEYEADPRQADSSYLARDERRFNKIGRLGVSLDHAFSAEHGMKVAVFAEPKYLQRSERGTYRDFNRYHIGAQGSYAWTTAFGPVVSLLQAGFDEAYQDGSQLFYSVSSTGGRGTSLRQNRREAANSAGIFLQEELKFGNDWSVILGGRYDVVSYTSQDFITPRLDADKDFTALTPKFGISYRLSSTHTLYAAYGGGLEAAAFNEIDPPAGLDTTTSLNPRLEPIRSTTYELGAKGYFLRPCEMIEAIQYDVAGYYIDIRDDLVPWNGGRWYFTAGRSHRTGLEVGVIATTGLGLSLHGSSTITSNVYDEYLNDIYGDQSGKNVAGLPGIFATVRLRYTSPWHLFVEAGLRHVGEYYAEDTNSDISRIDPYTLLSAGVGGAFAIGSLDLTLNLQVDNIADAHYVASAYINGANGRYFEPGTPRNLFGTIGLRWRLTE